MSFGPPKSMSPAARSSFLRSFYATVDKEDLASHDSRALAAIAWSHLAFAGKRRRGHALGVIAGGERHDAARALFRRDGGELVIGAAELERAGALQGLGFEKNPPAGHGVERGRGQKRGMQHHAGKPAGRVIDVGCGRQGYRSVHSPTVTPRLRHEQGR